MKAQITDVRGVGPSTARALEAQGLRSVAALAKANIEKVTAVQGFAATRAAEEAAQRARKFGITEVEVRIKGAGSGRESAVTALQHAGIKITAVEDHTAIPFNGCRPRKKRRV